MTPRQKPRATCPLAGGTPLFGQRVTPVTLCECQPGDTFRAYSRRLRMPLVGVPIGRSAAVNLSSISLTLVPNLTGKSPTEAATELRAAGLELGVIREVGPSGSMIVLEQSTLPLTVAPRGTRVNLLVGVP
ncbi:PASTA domain-containing protein [Dactylosporangium aurantiacum]|uniref:PASTA domain-containing protein n=2 Tax=Dactylosporangium aurantiacum TaxID=35754 RepID=UPI0009DF93E3